jgi:UDP-3-O-acyl-N-acetylglucosamine deacetylase
LIRDCGIIEQEAYVPEIMIAKTLLLGEESEEGKFIKVEPADVFSIRYTCVYPEPLGRQSHDFVMNSPGDFERDIAPSRTYGFVDEINKLSEMGLAEGGRMNNFILIDKDRIINTKLRFPDELARHKILDIIGDFYLLGRPIRGKVTAQKTGHADNARMVNWIKDVFMNRGSNGDR